MNTARNHERLDAISAEIDRLEAKVIETERRAMELFASEADAASASAAVTEIHARLVIALKAYRILGEVIRRAERSGRRAA